jgi:hypothetical protein
MDIKQAERIKNLMNLIEYLEKSLNQKSNLYDKDASIEELSISIKYKGLVGFSYFVFTNKDFNKEIEVFIEEKLKEGLEKAKKELELI